MQIMRSVALLLVPCLIADPVTAYTVASPSVLRVHVPPCNQAVFEQEALINCLTYFFHVFSRRDKIQVVQALSWATGHPSASVAKNLPRGAKFKDLLLTIAKVWGYRIKSVSSRVGEEGFAHIDIVFKPGKGIAFDLIAPDIWSLTSNGQMSGQKQSYPVTQLQQIANLLPASAVIRTPNQRHSAAGQSKSQRSPWLHVGSWVVAGLAVGVGGLTYWLTHRPPVYAAGLTDTLQAGSMHAAGLTSRLSLYATAVRLLEGIVGGYALLSGSFGILNWKELPREDFGFVEVLIPILYIAGGYLIFTDNPLRQLLGCGLVLIAAILGIKSEYGSFWESLRHEGRRIAQIIGVLPPLNSEEAEILKFLRDYESTTGLRPTSFELQHDMQELTGIVRKYLWAPLGVLEKKGYVNSSAVDRPDGPPEIEYSITPLGIRALKRFEKKQQGKSSSSADANRPQRRNGPLGTGKMVIAVLTILLTPLISNGAAAPGASHDRLFSLGVWIVAAFFGALAGIGGGGIASWSKAYIEGRSNKTRFFNDPLKGFALYLGSCVGMGLAMVLNSRTIWVSTTLYLFSYSAYIMKLDQRRRLGKLVVEKGNSIVRLFRGKLIISGIVLGLTLFGAPSLWAHTLAAAWPEVAHHIASHLALWAIPVALAASIGGGGGSRQGGGPERPKTPTLKEFLHLIENSLPANKGQGTVVTLRSNMKVRIDEKYVEAHRAEILAGIRALEKVYVRAKGMLFTDELGITYVDLAGLSGYHLEQRSALIMMAIGKVLGLWDIVPGADKEIEKIWLRTVPSDLLPLITEINFEALEGDNPSAASPIAVKNDAQAVEMPLVETAGVPQKEESDLFPPVIDNRKVEDLRQFLIDYKDSNIRGLVIFKTSSLGQGPGHLGYLVIKKKGTTPLLMAPKDELFHQKLNKRFPWFDYGIPSPIILESSYDSRPYETFDMIMSMYLIPLHAIGGEIVGAPDPGASVADVFGRVVIARTAAEEKELKDLIEKRIDATLSQEEKPRRPPPWGPLSSIALVAGVALYAATSGLAQSGSTGAARMSGDASPFSGMPWYEQVGVFLFVGAVGGVMTLLWRYVARPAQRWVRKHLYKISSAGPQEHGISFLKVIVGMATAGLVFTLAAHAAYPFIGRVYGAILGTVVVLYFSSLYGRRIIRWLSRLHKPAASVPGIVALPTDESISAVIRLLNDEKMKIADEAAFGNYLRGVIGIEEAENKLGPDVDRWVLVPSKYAALYRLHNISGWGALGAYLATSKNAKVPPDPSDFYRAVVMDDAALSGVQLTQDQAREIFFQAFWESRGGQPDLNTLPGQSVTLGMVAPTILLNLFLAHAAAGQGPVVNLGWVGWVINLFALIGFGSLFFIFPLFMRRGFSSRRWERWNAQNPPAASTPDNKMVTWPEGRNLFVAALALGLGLTYLLFGATPAHAAAGLHVTPWYKTPWVGGVAVVLLAALIRVGSLLIAKFYSPSSKEDDAYTKAIMGFLKENDEGHTFTVLKRGKTLKIIIEAKSTETDPPENSEGLTGIKGKLMMAATAILLTPLLEEVTAWLNIHSSYLKTVEWTAIGIAGARVAVPVGWLLGRIIRVWKAPKDVGGKMGTLAMLPLFFQAHQLSPMMTTVYMLVVLIFVVVPLIYLALFTLLLKLPSPRKRHNDLPPNPELDKAA
jgi:hypothetical protein